MISCSRWVASFCAAIVATKLAYYADREFAGKFDPA
jgi:hypothetical protein